jgi:hypothetical protein
MPAEPLATEKVLSLLTENPRRIAALTAGLTPAQLHNPAKGGDWSLNDILAHLRACADQWGGCMAAMIAEDRPTLRAINPRSWINQTNYRELEFRTSLRAYTRQRAKLLAALEPLPPNGWSRSATVTGAGAVVQRTVFFYARWLSNHERSHVKQIERIVSARGQVTRRVTQ